MKSLRISCQLFLYHTNLKEIPMEIPQVYELDLEKQNDHFVNFLYWLKAGNHTEKNNLKVIHNGTCNAYLCYDVVYGYRGRCFFKT